MISPAEISAALSAEIASFRLAFDGNVDATTAGELLGAATESLSRTLAADPVSNDAAQQAVDAALDGYAAAAGMGPDVARAIISTTRQRVASAAPTAARRQPRKKSAPVKQTTSSIDRPERSLVLPPVMGPDDGANGPDWTRAIRDCLDLDKSDTDNAKRLLRYFGNNLLVLAQEGVSGGDFLCWTGTHWDWGGGVAGAAKVAQKVGDMICLEADALVNSKAEAAAIEAGKAAAAELKALGPEAAAAEGNKLRVAELKDLIVGMKAAQLALAARRKTRRTNGVAAKNGPRIRAMLDCAAPHLRRAPEEFNADPLVVVTQTHTLRFMREVDLECPDPDVTRYRWSLQATLGHRREDLVLAAVPVDYDPTFAGPKWDAFIARFQPRPAKARTVQQFSGVGLTGLPVQKLMYHVGRGANAKSTFLEAYTRALGPSFAVGLPAESVAGTGERGPGQASPDLARLFGKRVLRVLELKPGAPLQIEIIKRLTGGEKIPVRHLNKGFFEFQPRAKVHMSGNDYPRLDGSDGGMKRRLLVAEWTEVIAEHEQKDLEEVVADLLTEAPAILNWLIEGALDFLNNGLVVAEEIAASTADYFNDMDPCEMFVKAHLVDEPGENVQARVMYRAYLAWSAAATKKPMSETRFSGTMKKKGYKRADGRLHMYLNVRLVDVPVLPVEQPPLAGEDFRS
jgi:putative DNA primase/helicase